jgi:hypothetical protein
MPLSAEGMPKIPLPTTVLTSRAVNAQRPMDRVKGRTTSRAKNGTRLYRSEADAMWAKESGKPKLAAEDLLLPREV